MDKVNNCSIDSKAVDLLDKKMTRLKANLARAKDALLKGYYDRAKKQYFRLAFKMGAIEPNMGTHADEAAGALWVNKKNLEKYLSVAKEALTACEEAGVAYLVRGLAYSLRCGAGSQDNAITDFTAAIGQNIPDRAEAYRLRGIEYVYNGNYELAIADFDEALKINQEDAKSYLWRGNAYGNTDLFHKSALPALSCVATNCAPLRCNRHTWRTQPKCS